MTTLVADVGGTNTRVAIFFDEDMTPTSVRRFRNAEFASLEAVLKQYLADLDGVSCSAACVAVAGPVRDGIGRMTNLDWVMDGATLCTATGAAQGFVINDLEAQGHALDDVDTRCVLGHGRPAAATSTRLVVGLGTGFNAAPVHPVEDGSEFYVVASECGHASMPVQDQTGLDLSLSLRKAHGFASIEEALAGRGLLAINAFVAAKSGAAPHDSTQDLIAALSGTPTATDTATAGLYCQLLGQVLGDLALVHLPWGGIYLIGGMARAMSPFFATHGLSDAFHDKGRFSTFMDDFAIHMVEDDYAALTGCARYVRRHS
ncbi:glucokinase [Pseudoruegeria sp. SK021]|uniref:glucokinase n=1 Tax=Pseudoruegeria sp. SK021 TaxID=1933035 RepID=UPI000A24326A|nr:glucokinase [Pseudoruegeria sp. SK021]OSP56164.1 hypothetical protein BV911_04335 [Pseudoruegeria sp. SK021]